MLLAAFVFLALKHHFHTIKHYLVHLLTAKGRHSIHSPFLFDLYENCVSTGSIFDPLIEARRIELMASKESINVEDFGAGSRVHSSLTRRISQIAKYSSKPRKESQFIACLAHKIHANAILELGTSFGLTTAYIAKANPKASIHSIEGSAEIASIALQTLAEVNCKNVKIHIGKFEEHLSQLYDNELFDLVFIDGNHTLKATIDYFEHAIEHIHQDGFIIFDDIYWSEEMTTAWYKIINHPKVNLSVDLFHLGVISPSKNFSKQHFKLRF